MCDCFCVFLFFIFFFFNDTATTEIYTLSLHDALPIYARVACARPARTAARPVPRSGPGNGSLIAQLEHDEEITATRRESCSILNGNTQRNRSAAHSQRFTRVE